MITDQLKISILNSAFTGNLSKTLPSDTDILIMMQEIEKKHNKLVEQKVIKLDKKIALPKNNDIPYVLPPTWYWNKLYFVIDVRDGTHDSPKYYKEGIPLVTSKNLNEDGTINLDNVKFISEDDAKIINNRSKVDVGDILFAMIGSIGNPVVITDKIDFCIKNVALFKNPIKNLLDNDYLYYYLYFSQQKMKKESSGGVQQFVSLHYLRNFYIPLPPIEEQQRIVKKIKQLFNILDEIKLLEDELKNLKEKFTIDLSKSIVNYGIRGKLTVSLKTDSDVNTIIPNHLLYSDNEKKFNLKLDEKEFPFNIPDSWKWVKLGMLFKYQNGYPYKPSETSKNNIGIPIIKSQNIMKRIVEINSKTSFIENPTKQMLKTKICEGDFLMCLSSQSNNTEPLGKTAIYNLHEIALLNQRVLKLTPLNYELSKYLYYVINSFYFHNTVSHKSGGSAQSNLKVGHVMEMYIPLPPLEEQQRIVDKLEQLLPLCDDVKNIVEKLNDD